MPNAKTIAVLSAVVFLFHYNEIPRSKADIFSDAVDSATGVVEDVGDALDDGKNGIIHAIENGTNLVPQDLKTKISSIKFNANTGQVRVDGSFTIPGASNSPCKFSIVWNPQTSSFESSSVEIGGKSVQFDPTNLSTILENATDHAFDWIPNFGMAERVIESDYDDIYERLKKQYGDDNVYLASEQFVSWACPTTVGKAIVAEITSSGAATKILTDSVRSHAQMESQKIADWLKGKLASQLDEVLRDLFSGKDPSANFPSLDLRWQNIEYKSHVKILGQDVNATTIPETHWGFVLIWHPGSPLNFSRLPNTGTMTRRNADLPALNLKWQLGVTASETGSGYFVAVVGPGTAAENAGIRVGETIKDIDGMPVGNQNGGHWTLWRILERSQNGQVKMTILDSNRNARSVTVQLQKLNP
jgi:hypothetical protein